MWAYVQVSEYLAPFEILYKRWSMWHRPVAVSNMLLPTQLCPYRVSMMLSALAGKPLVGLHGDLLRMMDNSVYLKKSTNFRIVFPSRLWNNYNIAVYGQCLIRIKRFNAIACLGTLGNRTLILIIIIIMKVTMTTMKLHPTHWVSRKNESLPSDRR